jgi:hypothetical protein
MTGPTRRDRPHIPDYGIPTTDEGLLDWAWARDQLRDALVYWVSTIRPEGRPHAMPTWGVWLDDTFWFEGGTETRRVRNLAVNPSAVVSIGGVGMALIVEGVVEMRLDPDPALGARLVEGFAKYRVPPYEYEADPANWRSDAGGLWMLRPTVVFGWQAFPKTCTRWTFD